jgi:hypothetical protein
MSACTCNACEAARLGITYPFGCTGPREPGEVVVNDEARRYGRKVREQVPGGDVLEDDE